MNDPMGPATKLEAAKKSLTTVLDQIQPGSNVGLRVFGKTPVQNNVSESCTDSQLVIPIGPLQKEEMIASVYTWQAFGQTPIGFSLEQAAKDFSPSPDVKKTIILISDGDESCGKDPISVIENLKAQGIGVVVNAVGFDVDPQARAQLTKLAEASGGKYVDAKDAAELQEQLVQVAQDAGLLLRAQRGGGTNLLAAGEGARIVSASSEEFSHLIDGREEKTGAFYGGEIGVFSFKEGQAVLLEKFAIPITEESPYNPGKIELLGSLEGPDRGFFPVTVIQPQNKVIYQNVNQEFPIAPPVAVRYLKAIVGPGVGGAHSYMTEWRVYGKYLTAAELAGQMKKQGQKERNLLAGENGGKLVAASDNVYQALIDGSGTSVGKVATVPANSEAIFGFEGGKTALIKKFAIPITQASKDNVRTVEFWVSEESPTSGFTKIGTFETTNLVFAENPYQEYKVEAPARAKYLKVKVLNSHGGYDWNIQFAELQALGTFAE